MAPRIKGLETIPLDQLVVGDSQARKRDIATNIEELMDSIEKVGLLQPIIVCPQEDSDKLVVLAGQRRLLAHEKLEKDTIMAVVFDQPVDELQAMLISLSENAVRQDMVNPDYIDACGYLYEKYGTLKEVSNQTGIPYQLVSKYVKIDRLSPTVRDAVLSKEITMDAAIRGTQAAEAGVGEGNADPEEVLTYALALSPLSGVQQKKVVSVKQEDPEKDFTQVMEDAATNKQLQVVATISPAVHGALKQYATSDGMKTTQDEAAGTLIEAGLRSAGFLTQ